jgi:hypothetical protein
MSGEAWETNADMLARVRWNNLDAELEDTLAEAKRLRDTLAEAKRLRDAKAFRCEPDPSCGQRDTEPSDTEIYGAGC